MNIGILGAGTWGTALARMLCNMGYGVTVWSALERELEQLSRERKHPNLEGMIIPDDVKFTENIGEACIGMDFVLIAVPSVYVRTVSQKAKAYISENTVIVNLAKGIEPESFMTMTDIIADELGKNMKIVALSGPTHAEEVSKDLPTTIVSASSDIKAAEKVQNAFSNSFFRVYTNTDVLGVELCGAVKNVIALAAGISSGLGYGDNAKAALITRGITELARLGVAMGCERETFYGLAGVGDLIVTATSVHSRNNYAGFLIGKGYSACDAVKEVGMVVEGLYALPATVGLSKKYGVEMPIVSAIDAVVNDGANPTETVNMLMLREYKNEI